MVSFLGGTPSLLSLSALIALTAAVCTGTHYMWEKLNRLGIDLHHEGVGKHGAVSWLYAIK